MSKQALKPFKSWWIYREGKPNRPFYSRRGARAWSKQYAYPGYRWTIVRVLVTPQKGK